MEFFAEQTGDVFISLGPDGVIRYVSDSVRAFGYEPSALVGSSGMQFVHPDDRAQFATSLAAALRGERLPAHNRTHRFQAGDGRWMWMEGNPRAVRDQGGNVIELVSVLRDVSERQRAEMEAAAQAEILSSAFRHAGVGKALVGLDGRFLRVNEAFCQLVGYPEPAMLDLDFQSITHPDDLGADLGLLDQLTRGELLSYRMDKRYLRADGAVIWAHLTVSMIRDADGAPKLYIAEVQDMTQRVRAATALKESEERFRRLAENARDLVMESAPDGTLIYLSPSTLMLTGYAPADVIGRTALKWLHPDDRGLVVEAFQEQVVTRGKARPRSIEYRLLAKDGRVVWMESAPRAKIDIVTGEVLGVTDTGRDVTARKMSEIAMSEARDAAEAAVRAKTDFMANMSHEIRTPLTAIIGFASVLGARTDLPDEACHQLQRISSASRALLAIVNDVLDFSSLEAGMMSIERRPTALTEVIADTVALFEPQAAAKHMELRAELADDLPTVDVAPDRLRQILLNLIGNAVKFTERGGVGVKATYDAADALLTVEVRDSGPGLSEDQQARLFQRFSQVDASSTRRHGGTGLGLAICRGLVEAMGGAVGIRSVPGAGSTFWFQIPAPISAPPPAEAMEEAQACAALEGLRLLIVDDNPKNRELARVLLTPLGMEITEAADGAEAVAIAADAPFDIILMDLQMPVCDGPDAVLQIRGRAGPNTSIPILAFTADFDLDRCGDQAIRGFDGVVRKPIDGKELIREIARQVAFDLGALSQRETAA